MSRNFAKEINEIADALWKPTAVPFPERGPLKQFLQDVARQSLASPEIPRAFTDPLAQSPASRPEDDASRPRDAVARTSSLLDPGAISRDEAAALARRLYEPRPAENRRRAVLFSAVGPEGLSARVSAAVADALASQTTASVCLIEGNLRSPTLRELLGLSVPRGLSEVLFEGGDVRLVLARVAANLWMLPGGSRGADARQCFSAEQLRPLFRELLDMFDYLVVDSAAANVHGDAVVLGPLVDGVVLVVAANGTRRETARRTVEHLQGAGSKVLGAVLADRTFPIPEVIYRKL